jgi:hypothetical protein
MEKRVLIGSWFICTLLATLLVLFLRRNRLSNWGLQLTEAMHIMVGGFSALSGFLLVYKMWTELDKLEPEVIVSMCLGSLATIWFGITEIGGLIPPPPKKP